MNNETQIISSLETLKREVSKLAYASQVVAVGNKLTQIESQLEDIKGALALLVGDKE